MLPINSLRNTNLLITANFSGPHPSLENFDVEILTCSNANRTNKQNIRSKIRFKKPEKLLNEGIRNEGKAI